MASYMVRHSVELLVWVFYSNMIPRPMFLLRRWILMVRLKEEIRKTDYARHHQMESSMAVHGKEVPLIRVYCMNTTTQLAPLQRRWILMEPVTGGAQLA